MYYPDKAKHPVDGTEHRRFWKRYQIGLNSQSSISSIKEITFNEILIVVIKGNCSSN